MSVLEQVVPEGYKLTDVGVIPNDWESINFGDLFEQSISRKSIKASDPVAFIGMQDVSESAQLTNPQQRVFEQVKTGFTYFERNDVLVAKITPCFENGKGCYTDKITTRFGFGSTEFHVLRAKENSDPKFIYFWTTRNSLRQDLEGEMVGSAGHRRVPFSAIQNYLIPCPSSRIEQTAIANALSDVDALLTELEKLIAKKQAIKTATMQQLLTGLTRLPQFAYYTEEEWQAKPKHSSGTNVNVGACDDGSQSGGMDSRRKSTKPSELGEIPEDWDVSTLGGAATFINGRAYALHEWETSGTPVIRLQNLTGRGADYYYSNLKLPEKQYCDNGDLLFMWSATFGPVIWKGDKAIYHYHIWKIENKEISDSKFLYFVLLDMTEKLKNSSSSGGTMLHITKSMMESTPCILPPKKEQTAIATILSDMDNEIQTLEQRLAKTRQTKQGMMQELLTGRTRLPISKEAV